ncbi:hypothetical protein MKZ38_007908 [Zalerion maritima]|uniref:Uncharacterized protein n=1 Tax=Zalerion maritima TaxID=339359 RepID=A0AAD5RI49_9PEZI|nr:hypothetical protein MKZ38_007908 [Zalerion maritima]
MSAQGLVHKLSPSELLDEKCRKSIEAILPSFSIDFGHASIPEDTNLWSLLESAQTNVSQIFNLADPAGFFSKQSTLQQIVRAVFPPSELAFFAPEEHTEILSCLEESEKALLLAQAVCAIIVVFARLDDAGKEICPGLLSTELQLFTEGDQLKTLMVKLENCHIWGKCYMKTQLEDAMLDAVEAARRDNIDLPDVNLGVDAQYGIQLSETNARNMGLPCGFHIMAIN